MREQKAPFVFQLIFISPIHIIRTYFDDTYAREIVKVTNQLSENPDDDSLMLAKIHLDQQRFALSNIRRRVITH